ncbi:hypothetical protein [Natronospora cellulosivora (SeqCode)]
MTDQIYYKVQYPLKKSINMLKAIDTNDPFVGNNDEGYKEEGLEVIKEFLDTWEEEKENLVGVISRLRKIQ